MFYFSEKGLKEDTIVFINAWFIFFCHGAIFQKVLHVSNFAINPVRFHKFCFFRGNILHRDPYLHCFKSNGNKNFCTINTRFPMTMMWVFHIDSRSVFFDSRKNFLVSKREDFSRAEKTISCQWLSYFEFPFFHLYEKKVLVIRPICTQSYWKNVSYWIKCISGSKKK